MKRDSLACLRLGMWEGASRSKPPPTPVEQGGVCGGLGPRPRRETLEKQKASLLFKNVFN